MEFLFFKNHTSSLLYGRVFSKFLKNAPAQVRRGCGSGFGGDIPGKDKDLSTGEAKTVSADTVVLALGTHGQQPLADAFEAAGLPTVLVGSAETPGRIAGAIRGGFEKAWVFDAE